MRIAAFALAPVALALCSITASAQNLRAGAARVDITPQNDTVSDAPTGKYDHEHLFVRAIVIDNGMARAALLGADQGGLSDAVVTDAATRIAADLNCPVTAVLMSATHTHSAGAGTGPGAPRPAPGTLAPRDKQIADALVAAAHDAKTKLQPAQMTFNTGTAYLNVNRDAIQPATHKWTQAPNTQAASDKTVAVLNFTTLDGKPIGIYVNYAMHPVNGYLANFTSADFAGAMSRYVEDAYDSQPTVIFSQGASGDQNPLYLRAATNGMAARSGSAIPGDVLVRETVEQPLRDNAVTGKPMDAKTRDRLERFMESEGQILGEEVIRTATDAKNPTRTARILGSEAIVTCPGRNRTDKGREGMTGVYTDGTDIPIKLRALGIGNVMLTAVNAEVYTLIGQRVKRESPMANTVFVTLANGRANSGYIPDDASFSHESFQVLSSRLKEGCAEDAITNGLTKLIRSYAEQQP